MNSLHCVAEVLSLNVTEGGTHSNRYALNGSQSTAH